jgi:hypothetical protein
MNNTEQLADGNRNAVVGTTVWWWIANKRRLCSGVVVSALWHEGECGFSVSNILVRYGPHAVTRLYPRSRPVWASEADAVKALQASGIMEDGDV